MEIFNDINYISIIAHIAVFLLIYYFFYKFILKIGYSVLTEDFEKRYKKNIKNNNTYFIIEFLYTFIGITIILSLLFVFSLIGEESLISVNIYLATVILAFLYCLKNGVNSLVKK